MLIDIFTDINFYNIYVSFSSVSGGDESTNEAAIKQNYVLHFLTSNRNKLLGDI